MYKKMAEYIEREALLERNMYGNTNPITHRTYAENLIKSAPSADVVEVVRCKDCKHWIYWADEKRCICDLHCTHTIRDDFCSFGERKEGAEE